MGICRCGKTYVKAPGVCFDVATPTAVGSCILGAVTSTECKCGEATAKAAPGDHCLVAGSGIDETSTVTKKCEGVLPAGKKC